MMNKRKLKEQILDWLEEDIGIGDISAQATVLPDQHAVGILYAKEDGVIAGLEVAELVFKTWDVNLQFRPLIKDGQIVARGTSIAEVEGEAQSILTSERLALNLLQRMSGVATLTRRYVDVAKQGNPAVRVVDTRKTTPGLRMLEKAAVRAGGGHNHRYGLYDAVMIKDNHIKAAGGIEQAVTRARAEIPHTMRVEVEVESIEQVKLALQAKVDIIMLDNMNLEDMRKAVEMIGEQAIVEASGGVNLETIRAIASTGVHVISVGALTHSYKALDISLDLNQRKR